MSLRLASRLSIALLVLAVTLVAACDPNANFGLLLIGGRTVVPPSPTTLSGGMGETLDGLSSFTLAVTRVDVVHRTVASNPATERVITVDSTPHTLQALTDLADTSTRMLGSLSVPEGFVFEVRFITSEARITIGGATYSVKLPSGEHTGLKVEPIDGVPFPIKAGERTGARIVLAPFEQLIRNRGDGFMFKPVVEAEHVSVPQLSAILLDQIIVGFKRGTTATRIGQINSAVATTIIDSWPPTDLYVIHLPTTITLEDALNYYWGQSDVEYALPDLLMATRGAVTPCDPGFHSPGPFTVANFPTAWGVTTGEPSRATIAVVDNGFDLRNRDLLFNWFVNTIEDDQTVAQQTESLIGVGCGCTGPLSSSDTDITATNFVGPPVFDFNGNGVTDFEDINQYFWSIQCTPPLPDEGFVDFDCDGIMDPLDWCCPAGACVSGGLGLFDGFDHDGSGKPNDYTGWDFGGSDNNPSVDNVNGPRAPHGTAVAGILGALAHQTGCAPTDLVAGTNWRARLIPVKVDDPSISADIQATLSRVIMGINYAARLRATVINVSSGFAATRQSLEAYNLGANESCQSGVVQGIGSTKFDKLAEQAAKLMDPLRGGINLEWPGDTGESVLVVAAPNCPLKLAPNDPEFFDFWANARAPSQPIIIVGGLNISLLDPFTSAETSAYGDMIDIGAPQSNFEVLNVPSVAFPQATRTDFTGTSFAAPLVAGTIALMVSANPAVLGGSALEAKKRLLCHCVTDPNTRTFNHCALDAGSAVVNAGVACP